MAVKPQLACSLQKCLRNVPDLSAFSEFTVLVEGVSFPCHKVILNACSEYFQALFRSQMKECQENRVDLQGVTKDAFVVIFDSLYKGFDGLTKINIIEVWHATVQLQIAFLIDECERFVKKTMTYSNCFAFYNHAEQLDSKRIKGYFFNFVCNNFDECAWYNQFNQLSAIDVYNIIHNDHLIVFSEDHVVRAILEWINYTEDSLSTSTESLSGIAFGGIYDIVVNTTIVDRKQHVVKLLSAVRLCLVSNECLRELFDDDIIMAFSAARDMIFRALDYKASVKHRHGPWLDTAVHRATSEKKHAMVFASGAKVSAYLLKDGSTHEYTKLPDPERANLAVFDNVLYMNNWKTLQIYTRDKVWNKLLDDENCSLMMTKRNMLLSLGSYIYRLNTRCGCLQRIKCTYGYCKTWKKCLTEISYVESIITYKEDILLFGALKDQVRTLCFSPYVNNVYTLSSSKPISGPLDGMVSFMYDGNVFVLQKNGHLWKLVAGNDEEINFEFQCELWGFAWQIYGSVVYQKQLFIFGSINCELKPKDFLWPTSLPGIIEKVKIVQIQSDTACQPIVLALNK